MLTKKKGHRGEAGSDIIFVSWSFFNSVLDANKSAYLSRPHDQRNCCLSESWTDLRSDSFRKECVWLGGNCGPTSCVNILSVLSNLSLSLLLYSFLCRYWALPLRRRHLAHLPPSLISSISPLLSSLYLHLHPLPACTHTLPRRHFHPHYSLPQPEPRQAGRLPGWGPRWCSGESASSGSLSLQDGRTALLWPIWPRPVLAPVCDYGPAGGEARLALGKNRASTQQTGGTNSPTL